MRTILLTLSVLCSLAMGEDLKILSASPKGELTGSNQSQSIQVVFNSPMVALEALPEGNGTGPLQISPKIGGKYRWKGADVLEFTPSSPLPLSTEFSARIPEGTKSVITGKALSSDYIWKFITMRPKVLRVAPASKDHSTPEWYDPLALKQPIYIYFNQMVDPKKIEGFVSVEPAVKILISTPPDSEVSRSYGGPSGVRSKKDGFRRDVIKILPLGQWQMGTDYTFALKKGLPGVEGSAGMLSDYQFTQGVYGPLRFTGLRQGNKDIKDGDEIQPEDEITITFNNKVPFEKLLSNISFSPPVELSRDGYSYDSRQLSIWPRLPPSSEYVVTIRPDVQDIYKNKLGSTHTIRLKTKRYKPYLKTVTDHGIVEAVGKRRIPVELVNADSVPFYFRKLTRDEIPSLLASRDLFSGRDPVSFPAGSWTYTKKYGGNIPPNKRTRLPIYLDSALGQPTGVVFMMVDNFTSDQDWTRYKKALLQVTNLGITAKFGYDNTAIFVTSLDKGDKLPGVDIEIRGLANKVVWTGKTDVDGKAIAPSWKSLGLRQQNAYSAPTQYVFAKKGEDWAFVSSEWGNSISPWRFNIRYEYNGLPEHNYIGQFICDRDLYRPGETVYCKGILRYLENGNWGPVKHKKVEVSVMEGYTGETVYDEEGEGEIQTEESKVVYRDTLDLFPIGSFEFKYRIPQTAKLIRYHINAHVIGFEEEGGMRRNAYESKEYFEGTFRVAEFRPAELEVKARLDRSNYVFGDKAKAFLSANYLFGAPVKQTPIRWVLRRSAFIFDPPGYEGYSFYDYTESENQYYGGEEYGPYRSSQPVASETGDLDKDGKLTIPLTLERGNFTGSALYELQGTVEGKSPQPVSSQTTFQVHAGQYYIGLKPKTTFSTEKKEIPVTVCAMGPNANYMAQKNIKVRIIRRMWNSIRKVGVDGRFSWISEKTDSLCFEQTINVGSDGSDAITYTPKKPGYYLVRASGTDSRGNAIKSGTSFYVTGSSDVSWYQSNDDFIEIIPERHEYTPGSVARLLIKSPYPKATALVTIEREGIMDSRWVTLNGTADKISIQIRKEYLPNIFISVMLLRGRAAPQQFDDNGEDICKPTFKIGYVGLKVAPTSKHLAVKVLPQKSDYQPGDSVNLTVSIPGLAGKSYANEVLVMAVDEGVLLLTGHKTPDPFNFFYKERPLLVKTAELRGSVIGERNYGEKGKNRGGSGFSPDLLKSLNDIFARGNFKTCAYFNPRVLLDKNGKASLRFKLPDNLTTFRIMAVAHTAMSEFGGGEAKIRVNKKLMLRPYIPRFLRAEDSVYAGVIAENYSTSTDTLSLLVSAKGLALRSNPGLRRVVERNGSVDIRFPFVALPGADSANFIYKGVLGQYSDGVDVKIPVVFERTLETVALSGNTKDTARQQLKLPADTYEKFGEVTTRLSSTALVGLGDGVNYLFEYPYGCLEQRTSRVLPLILFEEMVKAFGIKALKNDDTKSIIQGYLDDLSKFQTPNGGLGYWIPATYPSPYLSAYALLAVIRAEKKGYRVDTKVKGRIGEFLHEVLSDESKRRYCPYNSMEWYATEAFIVSVLAEAGQYQKDDMERLYAKRDQLPLFAKAFLFKANATGNGNTAIREDLRREIQNSAKIEAATVHFEEPTPQQLYWVYSSNVRTTAIVLQSIIEVEKEYPLADRIVRWLMQEQKNGRWRTTQENLYVFWALATYFDAYEKETPDFKAKVSVDGKTWLEDLFLGRSSKQLLRSLPFADLPKGKPMNVDFKKAGTGRLYYELRMRYAKKGSLPPRDEGISVSRKYETMDGKSIAPGDFKVGQTVAVRITVKTDRDRNFVAVNDPIPAGCEIIDTELSSVDKELKRKLQSTQASSQTRWWGSWNHNEMKDQRCLLFADYLVAGTHSYSYLMRATMPGRFYTPAIYAEEMYTPEVFGRGEEAVVHIQ